MDAGKGNKDQVSNENEKEKSTIRFERLRTMATVLGALLVPIVVAVVGQSYTAAIKEQESRARFVELAIEILREAPKQGTEDPLRQWAADIVNANSGTRLSEKARTALVETSSLPSGGRAEVDPVFKELKVTRNGGIVSISALSDCSERSNRVTMQILGGSETVVMSDNSWNEQPVIEFDPARLKDKKALLDAILDANDLCTMVLVMRQGNKVLRMEHVALVVGENFFGMPILIE